MKLSRAQVLTMSTLGLVAVGGLVTWRATQSKVEEAPFELITQDKDFELRSYTARVVAQTRVSGSEGDASNEGFRRLAGYIFGRNRESTKVAMTAPVGQIRDDGEWIVTFTMPALRTKNDLPTPVDERVVLCELEAKEVAVVRFSGRWTREENERQTQRLCAWIETQGWTIVSAPEINRYDPPWTLPFLRRNEVWIEVRRPELRG